MLVEVLKLYSTLLTVIFLIASYGPHLTLNYHSCTQNELCSEGSTCFMTHLVKKLLWYVQMRELFAKKIRESFTVFKARSKIALFL